MSGFKDFVNEINGNFIEKDGKKYLVLPQNNSEWFKESKELLTKSEGFKRFYSVREKYYQKLCTILEGNEEGLNCLDSLCDLYRVDLNTQVLFFSKLAEEFLMSKTTSCTEDEGKTMSSVVS